MWWVCAKDMAASPLNAAAPVGSCDNMMFDARTGIFHDSTHLSDRDRQNVENGAYSLNNFRDIDSCGQDTMRLALSHPNLRFKNGYGNFAGCNVDRDTKVRIRGPKGTNMRGRQQLSTRVAVAGPNLARSLTSADVESELLHSSDERQHLAYKGLPGVRADDHLTPLLPVVRQALQVEHIVPSWKITDTRALIRDADFARRSCAERRS
jgi:hypothetical protein